MRRYISHIRTGTERRDRNKEEEDDNGEFRQSRVLDRVQSTNSGDNDAAYDDIVHDEGTAETEHNRNETTKRVNEHPYPQHLSKKAGEIQKRGDENAELLRHGVQDGDHVLFPQLLAEQKRAHDKTDRETQRSLSPQKTASRRDHALRGSEQIASAYPRGDHDHRSHRPGKTPVRQRVTNNGALHLPSRMKNPYACAEQRKCEKNNVDNDN